MTRKHMTPASLAALFAQQAARQNATMQRDIKKQRAKLTDFGGGIAHPSIKASRKRTGKTTQNSEWADILNYAASFGYSGAAQSAGQDLAQMILGQRVR